MKREDIFDEFDKIEEPGKDFAKILSNLHYTHFFLMDRYKKILSAYELSLPQSNVLDIIAQAHPKPLSLGQTKQRVLEPNADVSRIVTRLVEKGFVEKVPDEQNRRKVAIRLTPKGFKMNRKIHHDKRFMQFTMGLTKEQALLFADTLAKLRNA